MSMHTPQEAAWRGEFGNAYTDRNMGKVPANRSFFRTILTALGQAPASVLELGCGAGENLIALGHLLAEGTRLTGVEINGRAVSYARERAQCQIHHGSLLDYSSEPHELVFTKGVLIHIPPTELWRAYRVLLNCSSRWIMLAEYYSPQPVEIPYRGEACMLWKRDFAGDMLTIYPELKLHSYGFVYRRDLYPQDDLNWFLMEKRQ
jgi:pseudaminic acid biosynthesis-associated methylase